MPSQVIPFNFSGTGDKVLQIDLGGRIPQFGMLLFSVPTSGPDASIGFGCFDASLNQWGVSGRSRDGVGTASDADSALNNASVLTLTTGSNAIDALGAITAVSASSVTLNVSQAAAGVTYGGMLYVEHLEGQVVAVGTADVGIADTSPKSFTGGISFAPKGAIFASSKESTAATGSNVDFRLCVGLMSATYQGCTELFIDDADTTSDAQSMQSSDSVLTEVGSGLGILSKFTCAFLNPGFQLSWSAAQGNRKFGYALFGGSITVGAAALIQPTASGAQNVSAHSFVQPPDFGFFISDGKAAATDTGGSNGGQFSIGIAGTTPTLNQAGVGIGETDGILLSTGVTENTAEVQTSIAMNMISGAGAILGRFQPTAFTSSGFTGESVVSDTAQREFLYLIKASDLLSGSFFASQTIGVTMSASGTETISGTFSASTEPAAMSASGTITASTFSSTLAGATMGASGLETIPGDFSSTLADVTMAASGITGGAFASDLAGVTMSANGIILSDINPSGSNIKIKKKKRSDYERIKRFFDGKDATIEGEAKAIAEIDEILNRPEILSLDDIEDAPQPSLTRWRKSDQASTPKSTPPPALTRWRRL